MFARSTAEGRLLGFDVGDLFAASRRLPTGRFADFAGLMLLASLPRMLAAREKVNSGDKPMDSARIARSCAMGPELKLAK